MKIFLSYCLFFKIFCFLFVPSCVFNHEDDVLPTPVVPLQPPMIFEMVNGSVRSIKKINLNIELLEDSSCFSTYNLSQCSLSLTSEKGEMIKSSSELKRDMIWLMRLNDGETYSLDLTFDPKGTKLASFKMTANQDDQEVSLKIPCR